MLYTYVNTSSRAVYVWGLSIPVDGPGKLMGASQSNAEAPLTELSVVDCRLYLADDRPRRRSSTRRHSFARRASRRTRSSLCRSFRAPSFQAPTVAATPHGTRSQPAALAVRRSDTPSSSFRPVHVIQATTSGDSHARQPSPIRCLRPGLCSKRFAYPDLRITVAPCAMSRSDVDTGLKNVLPSDYLCHCASATE